MIWHRDSYLITNDRHSTAIKDTFELLQSTYWAHRRPLETVEKILEHSLCFFLIQESTQIGFARVITDYASTSWLADVVIAENSQNQGLGNWMMDCVLHHPDIRHTQFVLQTGSAHEFYQRLGFRPHESLLSTPVDYL